MNIVAANIKTIKKTLGYSMPKLIQKLNKGLAEEDKFTEDQGYNYESGRTPADQAFLRRLCEITGLPVMDLTNKKLTAKDITVKSPIVIKDAPGDIIERLIKIEARLLMLTSSEAERTAKETGQKVTDVLREMNKAVRLEADSLMGELQRKS